MRLLAAMLAGLALAFPLLASPALAAPVDSTSPRAVAQVFTDAGAEAEVKPGTDHDASVVVKARGTVFNVIFLKCDALGQHCGVITFQAYWNRGGVTLDQINGWNQQTILCPAFIRKDGMPSIWLPVRASNAMESADLKAQMTGFADCTNNFSSFLANPEAWLKAQR